MNGVLSEVRAQVSALNAERAAVLQRLAQAAVLGTAASDAARDAAAAGDATAAASHLTDAADQRSARRDLHAELRGLDDQVAGTVDQLVAAGLDPCDADPDLPLMLLPVRLETRFSPDGATLRVRIYPDDSHIDRIERGLTPQEVELGTAYWTALWSGTKTDAAAWAQLNQALHPARAPWAAHALTPTNLADRPDPPGPVPAPVFPDVDGPTLRPPVARALPDRFVVRVQQGTTQASVAGKPVPSEVAVGLPRDDDPSVLVSSGGATLGPGMEWMADFAEAERVGLAVTVPVPQPGVPVDLVLAFGVRSSLDAAATSEEVTALLTAHRFGEGAAFLAQGTPTNNTETDRAAWTRRPVRAQPPTRATDASAGPGSGADRLARALGVDGSVLAGLEGADQDEQALPSAINTALWSATWGTWFDRMVANLPGGGLDDVRREELRGFFADLVRGRGPLPAIRLGNQPYGVLPVSDLSRNWSVVAGTPFESGLVVLLQRIRALLRPGTADVPSVVGAASLDEALLEVLGSSPLALGVRVRSVASESSCSVVPALLGIDPGKIDTELQAVLDAILWQSLGFAPGVVGLTGSLGKTTRPVGLALADDSDPDFISALPDADRKVTTVLQALLELALDADTRAVAAAAPPETIGKLLELSDAAGQQLPDSLRETVVAAAEGHVDPERLHFFADDLARRVGPAGPVRLARESPVAMTRGTLADSAMLSGLTSQASGQLALRALQAWLRATARLDQTRAALAVIAASSTEQRRYATAEALDCCSHRLDAWLTAPVTRRLSTLRATTATGLQVGAYGWVENLVQGAGSVRDGGYLLTPSLTHAATAGVLRSAYLSHNPDGGGSGAFAVDLSSARVRRALAVLDGVRSGQPVGALLGYHFERLLRESAHDVERFVASLRALAPLNVGRIADRAEAPPPQAQEAITANNVVDGTRLLALRDGGTDIRAALAVAPTNNIYLPPDQPWTPPTDAQWAAIDAAMEAIAADHDAVADLLMAEGVHQLVQGNTARAAAVLDAAASGDAPPPDPEVVQIPPRGAAITHRLVLLMRDVASGSHGWTAQTPRAKAEPRLAAWAEKALGPADQVVVQVAADGTRTTLDTAGLAALDVVYDAAPGVLERRVRVAVPWLDPADLAARRDPSWPPGLLAFGELLALATSLRRLVVASQPTLPAALTRTGDQPVRVVSPAALQDLLDRTSEAASGLGTAGEDLAAVLGVDDPDPDILRAAVDAVAAYGVAPPGDPGDPAVATAVRGEATRRHDAAVAALATGHTLAAAAVAVDAVFGTGFHVLPVVSSPAPDLYRASFGRIDPGQARLRRFLSEHAPVRDAIGRYAETLMLCDALGVARRLRVAQLAPAGTRGADQWMGMPFSGAHPSPDLPVTVVLAECPDAATSSDPVAGLVVDEWVEVAPKVIERPDGAGGTTREATVVTGIAANVDIPNTRAPQSILIAVTPDDARWTSDSLAGVLASTLDLAKLRGMTLERAPWVGRVLPALVEQSWSLQGEKTIDTAFLLTQLASPSKMIQFVKE